MSKVIEFWSLPVYFEPEKKGLKRNTVRFTDDWTADRWMLFKDAKFVRIKEYDKASRASFMKKIVHRCTYKNVAIISW